MATPKPVASCDELLWKAFHNLEAISKQWDDKGLGADFFTTPFEMRALIAEIGNYIHKWKPRGELK